MGCGSSTNKHDIVQPMTSTPVKEAKPVQLDKSIKDPAKIPQVVAPPNTETASPIKPTSEVPKAVKDLKEEQRTSIPSAHPTSTTQSTTIIGEDDKLVEDSWKDCENNFPFCRNDHAVRNSKHIEQPDKADGQQQQVSGFLKLVLSRVSDRHPGELRRKVGRRVIMLTVGRCAPRRGQAVVLGSGRFDRGEHPIG
eukprot:761074-Hanusia_phi.AAC.7